MQWSLMNVVVPSFAMSCVNGYNSAALDRLLLVVQCNRADVALTLLKEHGILGEKVGLISFLSSSPFLLLPSSETRARLKKGAFS